MLSPTLLKKKKTCFYFFLKNDEKIKKNRETHTYTHQKKKKHHRVAPREKEGKRKVRAAWFQAHMRGNPSKNGRWGCFKKKITAKFRFFVRDILKKSNCCSFCSHQRKKRILMFVLSFSFFFVVALIWVICSFSFPPAPSFSLFFLFV